MEVREVRSGFGERWFWEALELYVETFPRDERVPLEEFAAGFGAGGGHRVLLAEDGDRFLGLAWFGLMAGVGVGHLVYLVTAEDARGSGVGGRLLREVVEFCERAGCRGVFFECERPDLAGSGEERAVRERRLGYFRRQGAVEVSWGYVQPAMGEGRSAVPMVLMGIGFAGGVREEEIVGFLAGLGYGQGDAAVGACLEGWRGSQERS